MNYYSFHIGDYLSATAHLSIIEHGAYRRLLDIYYIHESPLPNDVKQIYRLVGARSKEEREAVDSVLAEFFQSTPEGFRHDRCDHEIALCNKNRANGKKGGRPSKNQNPKETQTETQPEPKANPKETQSKPNRNPTGKPPITPSPHHPITPSQSSASTAEPPPGQPKAAPSPPAKVAPLVIELAVELRKVGVACTASHPRVLEWAAQGVTVQQALEAVQVARMRKPEGEPISANYLAPIIAEMRNPKPTPEPPWWNTPEATIAKGESLGIRAKPGEQMAEYRERIREAVKGQRAAA